MSGETAEKLWGSPYIVRNLRCLGHDLTPPLGMSPELCSLQGLRGFTKTRLKPARASPSTHLDPKRQSFHIRPASLNVVSGTLCFIWVVQGL